jgi:hypothetical protein
MKTRYAYYLWVAVLTPGVPSGAAASQIAEGLGGPTHAPMKPYHNPDGTLKRGLRGQITTQTWSRYAVTAGAPYTSASATWQVPDVFYDGKIPCMATSMS